MAVDYLASSMTSQSWHLSVHMHCFTFMAPNKYFSMASLTSNKQKHVHETCIQIDMSICTDSKQVYRPDILCDVLLLSQ